MTLRLFVLLLLIIRLHAADRPNLIWIMADDLGYAELGCYGQKIIQTPCLDRMAREGMRFTQFYAGATVCAPSRSVLMTGQHQGQTRVRGNAGKERRELQALHDGEVTVARVLQQAGYRTALVGKWGLGDEGPAASGLPHKQGFDYFYGYLNQTHAHNHYPDFLWKNEERVPLPNVVTPVGDQHGGYATERKMYADDLFADESLQFVRDNAKSDRPFFLYWSMVVPHANNERNRVLKDGTEVPDLGSYADKDWSAQDKGQAAMVTRMDSYVGRMMNELQKLGIAEKTLVIFTSDNGPHNESSHNVQRFAPAGRFSGLKRSLTDGGIRVPAIAWWRGKVAAGTEQKHVAYFGDWMATACELSGAALPADCNSISFAPALLGKEQKAHDYLYWEFHEGGFRQAALYQGRWKGIRPMGRSLALYDLQSDPAERIDLAAKEPSLAKNLARWLDGARTDSPNWPARPGK